tara:strand:+ start:184 stop:492 length:309 start_codon:yes stop_codon:yes gene_type:complete
MDFFVTSRIYEKNSTYIKVKINDFSVFVSVCVEMNKKTKSIDFSPTDFINVYLLDDVSIMVQNTTIELTRELLKVDDLIMLKIEPLLIDNKYLWCTRKIKLI